MPPDRLQDAILSLTHLSDAEVLEFHRIVARLAQTIRAQDPTYRRTWQMAVAASRWKYRQALGLDDDSL